MSFNNNEDYAIYADHANWIYMNEGENSFWYDDYFEEKCEVETITKGGGRVLPPRPDIIVAQNPEIISKRVTCHPLVYGTLCGLEEGQGTTFNAQRNYWPSSNSAGNPHLGEYAIDLYQGCRPAGAGTYEGPGVAPALSITTMPELSTPISCLTSSPSPNPVCCLPVTEIRCNNYIRIVTEAFSNVRLNTALKTAIEEAQQGLKQANSEQVYRAIDWLHQILSYPYEQLDEVEKRILDVTHRQLQKTVRDFIAMDSPSISETQKNKVLKTALASIRRKEQAAVTENNYRELVSTSLEKAQHYRLTNQRDESLNVLQEMTTWVDASDQEQVNRFTCLIEREIAVLDKTINSADFFKGLIEECNSTKSDNIIGKSGSWLTYQTEDKPINPNTTFEVFVYPNPSKDIVNITVTGEESIQAVKVISPIGSQMYSSTLENQEHSFDVSTWEKGMYFIVLSNNEGEVVTVKKVTVM